MTDQTSVPTKRIAIVGTHPTHKATPWNDHSIEVASLNDAYLLGFPRANAWYDLHPIPEMSFQRAGQRKVSIHDAPVGGYLRPEGHLDWLKTRSFPVFLHDCEQCECAQRVQDWKDGKLDLPFKPHDPYPFPAWPNAMRFPFQAVEAQFGHYFSSTPAWMLAHRLMEGYRDIHITGIALATEWEYINQRPNMEFLIGMALAQGVQFTIPHRSTLLRGKHKYAVEPKPNLHLEHVDRQISILKQEGALLQQRLANLKWYQRSEAADIHARLRVVETELLDARQNHQRLASLARVA